VEDKLPGVSGYTLQELIDRFNIYTTGGSSPESGIKLLMPKLWRELIDIESIPELDFLKNMDATFVDKGKALEVVTQRMISLRCNFKGDPVNAYEVFPFLLNRNTCFDGIKIGPLVTTLIDMKLTKTTTAADLRRNGVLLGNPDKDLLLTFRARASSMDLGLVSAFQSSKFRPMLEIQCKNVKSGFCVSILNEEIVKGKFFREVTRNGDTSSVKRSLFVVILTGVGDTNIEIMRGKVLDSSSGKEFGVKIELFEIRLLLLRLLFIIILVFKLVFKLLFRLVFKLLFRLVFKELLSIILLILLKLLIS
jgi:hypothetical protein